MAALGAARFTSPSAGPAAARIDHLNRQVSELVSRNKDLDARNTSITRELADSNARTQQALEEQAAKFAVERADLHDFVLYVQGAGRIAALQTEDQLYATRIEVLKGQDLVRKEKIRTSERDTRGLQRDWDLLLLTQENSRLTHELEIEKEERAFDKAEFELTVGQQLRQARNKVAKLEEQRRTVLEHSRTQEEAKASFEEETNKLRIALETAQTKVERLTLKLDGGDTARGDLERKVTELKLTNKDLRQQLEKWQSLEKKGGSEVEELRRAKIELESQLREAEGRVKEGEQEAKVNAKALYKEQKAKAQLIVEREELQDKVDALQSELDQAKRAAKRALSLDESVRPSSSSHASSSKPKARPPPPPPENDNESEVEVQKPPSAKARKPKSASIEPAAASKGKGKAKATDRDRSASHGANSEDEDDGKRGKKRPRPQADSDESEIEEVEAPKPKKAKASSLKPGGNDGAATKTKRDKPPSSNKQASSSSKPASSDAASKKPSSKSSNTGVGSKSKVAFSKPVATIREESEEEQEAAVQPKKKRKVLLPAAEPTSFVFQTPVAGGSKKLGIPTQLSPTKPGQAAQPKGFFAKMGGFLG